MSVLGLDIGGANLKFFASHTNSAGSLPFRLWERPEDLQAFLTSQFQTLPSDTTVVATMTGELCDCFETKSDGVRHIAESTAAAFGPHRTWFYQLPTDMSNPPAARDVFVSLTTARRNWTRLAAANWHATATWLAGEAATSGHSLLIDIGSTTTDLIPLSQGQVASRGIDDWGRIQAGELVYSGLSRTPVFGVLPQMAWQDSRWELAKEWFATMGDVYRVLGRLPEAPDDCRTCDGRPATRAASARRLARTLCAEPSQLPDGFLMELARQAARAQGEQLRTAIERQRIAAVSRWESVAVCGEGAWLARELVESCGEPVPIVDLPQLLGFETSQAAAAVALVRLWERYAVAWGETHV